jgi:hypothetical protein
LILIQFFNSLWCFSQAIGPEYILQWKAKKIAIGDLFVLLQHVSRSKWTQHMVKYAILSNSLSLDENSSRWFRMQKRTRKKMGSEQRRERERDLPEQAYKWLNLISSQGHVTEVNRSKFYRHSLWHNYRFILEHFTKSLRSIYSVFSLEWNHSICIAFRSAVCAERRLIHQTNCSEVLSELFAGTHDSSTSHPRHTHGISMIHPRHIHDTPTTYYYYYYYYLLQLSMINPRHIHDISMTHPRHIHDSFTSHPRHIHDTSTTHPPHIHVTSTTHPRPAEDGDCSQNQYSRVHIGTCATDNT